VTATQSAGPAPEGLSRVEGPLKLTGAARYATDHRPDGVLHAVLVGAPVAAGRLRGVDGSAARALPGVTAVLTAADLPAFPELPPPSAVHVMPFADDRIRYEGQPVAIVLAESVEAAEAGRAAVAVDCEREAPVLIGHGHREPVMGEDRGDVDAVLADTHVEPATEASKSLYAVPALRLRQLVERVSLNVPTPMRAPVEGPGLWALESAMNELADAAGLDPLDVRLANFAEVSPADGRPWSANGLREAYQEGARRYGWRTRHERPRRDGPWVIGHGMATCTMGSFRFPGASRVRLRRDGAVVEANVHDIGTGVQTVLGQIAADELGISPDRVEMRWGDTDLPRTGPTYGSSTTVGTGSAVAAAARDVTKQLAELGQGGRDPLEALDRAGIDELVGEGTFELPGGAGFNADGAGTPYAIRTWGVIFTEVGVDPDFGLLRLRRAVGVYSAGRIVNPITARAQMTGGIIWGWGKATMEESDQEPTSGRWLAKNLSNVAVPVNADIPADIDVSFTDEYDETASLIGARGIGELGATGVDAAVAAAVHDAVGVRVRDLPILPWKVLAGL